MDGSLALRMPASVGAQDAPCAAEITESLEDCCKNLGETAKPASLSAV